jgi:hypothetical protein
MASEDPESEMREALMPDTADTGSNGFPEVIVKTAPLKEAGTGHTSGGQRNSHPLPAGQSTWIAM